MLARARTFTLDGLRARAVTVELDVRPGLPAFAIVGRADAAVREARDRVRAAILNSGYEFPSRRITANLAPADVPKAGPGIDLALACAVLAASGQLPCQALDGVALFGELALDGEVRAARGTLAVAQAVRRAGLRALLVCPDSVPEATHVDGLRVAAVGSLASAVRVLSGGAPDRPAARVRVPARAPQGPDGQSDLDLDEVRGQPHAVQALVAAAAGAHNALLYGAPGTGKTMLAQRLPSILPPLTREEAIEATCIHSAAGRAVAGELLSQRPFRAPHHTITAAGLIGGARAGTVGEAVLAHNGVLFLDELSEFARVTLEALRQPLEDGRVAIARSGHSAVYPTRFMLVAATNPCPCGYAGEHERCRCSEADLARHRRRLSGPLLDRLDLVIGMARRVPARMDESPVTSSSTAREQVMLARERQALRLRDEGVLVNAHMDAGMLRRHVALDEPGERLLAAAHARGLLSGRGQHRALRLARTLADLDGSRRVRAEDVALALALRTDAALSGTRAA